MLRQHALSLAVFFVLPSAALADTPLEPQTVTAEKPTVRFVGKTNTKVDRSQLRVRAKPVSKKKPNPPIHPLAKKLRSQLDRSIEQSSMVRFHAKRMEQGIRRSAKARLLANTLRRKLSQNTKLEKRKRGQLERSLDRAEEQSLPMQVRRKSQRKVQLAQLGSSGFAPERKLPASLVKKISLHYQRRAEIERILFLAAQLGDFATTAKAEKLLELENSSHQTMLVQAASIDP